MSLFAIGKKCGFTSWKKTVDSGLKKEKCQITTKSVSILSALCNTGYSSLSLKTLRQFSTKATSDKSTQSRQMNEFSITEYAYSDPAEKESEVSNEMAFSFIVTEQKLAEMGFSNKWETPIINFQEFVETLETFEEFLRYPNVRITLQKNPTLDPQPLYQKSCAYRYVMYKIYFHGCKLLWKKTASMERCSPPEKHTLAKECSALLRVVHQTGFDYLPIY